MDKALAQCDFSDVKLLTNQNVNSIEGVVKIPQVAGLDGYSKFCVRELHKYVQTPFALVCQYDGFPLNGQAWTDDFLHYDYIGAPFNPSGIIGNGGFSLRSKKLMEWMAKQDWEDFHPEDSCICIRHREEIESAGFKFAPKDLAQRFAFEGRSWDGKEWGGTNVRWENQFGFHSLLTPLSFYDQVCKIFTHSGDAGDVIYSLAAVKALGGGMMFLTPHNKYPYPLNSRWARMGGEADWVDNLAPLVEAQPYILKCRYTHGHPASTTHDLNRFRIPWKQRSARDNDSILKLHMDAFSLPMPTEPWLTVPDPIVVEGRPICVNRTPRYQDWSWDWCGLIRKHHKQMFFLGTEQEYEAFRGFVPECSFPHYPTQNCLELAKYISGAKMFFGNQSLCLAIAHGLHKPVLVETWKSNPNATLKRENAFYEIPEGWA